MSNTLHIPRPIELLAPARNADIAIEAIKHGADAVYMGASSHGARASAGNDISEIARVVRFAHQFGAKVYATVNTIIYDSEFSEVQTLVDNLYRIGTDALIVQDMAMLRMSLPPIALHASTQCDIHTPQKAIFLEQAGFSQLVVARELTLDEMAAIHRSVGIPIEAFVHGALCVSYSGDCQAGFATQRRSANRGECPQICRHSFDLTDGHGRTLISDRHLLSLKDLNRSKHLLAMLEAGVSSFKIEGRLKDAAYVKNTVAAYRKLLDDIIAAYPERYTRSSWGTSALSFEPDLNKSFNRGYTDYFTASDRPDRSIASIYTPKWTGEPVGKVMSATPTKIKAKLYTALANGDGLGFFDSDHRFHGFRLNRVDGNALFPAKATDIPEGTTLFRNHDRLRAELMDTDTARRTICVDLTLRTTAWGIALDAADSYGHRATATMPMEISEARKPQEESRRSALIKAGDTIFTIRTITDLAGNTFIPLSLISALRRNALECLAKTTRATHRYDYRKAESSTPPTLPDRHITYHDNVANRKAFEFYRLHGADSIEPAIETAAKLPDGDIRIMTTRYCLRREMDRCLRTPQGSMWPRELYLHSGPDRFRIDFDCKSCRMHVIKVAKSKPFL